MVENHTHLTGQNNASERHARKGIPMSNRPNAITEQMYKEYLSGKSLAQVGKNHGISRQAVEHRFMVRGLETRSKTGPRACKLNEVVKFIKEFQQNTCVGPTMEEVAFGMGVCSRSTAKRAIRRLEQQNVLVFHGNRRLVEFIE